MLLGILIALDLSVIYNYLFILYLNIYLKF